MALPPVIVTNFKRRITGVTTTAINVTAKQQALADFEIGLCGPQHEWKLWQVLLGGWQRPKGQKYRIWHVRRNAEMAWGLFAKRILRQPIRLVFTSASIRRHSAYPRWLISQMDAVVATSDKAASFLAEVRTVIHHGIDLQAFQPGKKTDYPSLVCVGRIREDKGTHILAEALIDVLPDFPALRAHFCGQALPGDQAYLTQMQDKIAAAGLSHQVIWHGEVSPPRVAALLAAAHIYAATPLHEEFGVTPFEGVASGCAIVVSDTGKLALATGQGETGHVVPVGDVQATARALRKLLENPDQLAQKMARARPLAERAFGIEQEAHALIKLYAELGDQYTRLAGSI